MNKVYLVGAGPGDIELLTVKALRLIQNADVLIYDRLINDDLLKETNKNTKLIYVGKEKGNHSVPQDGINELLYTESLNNKVVVRLKGGDPFVFGRGGEEALFLKQKGVSFEIVPGISSAISVPAYAGIPVTHRSKTASFRVVTGHRKVSDNIANINWDTFIADETIVFLMGLHNIELIVSKLLEVGKDENYPCAIISNGTTKNQKVITGTLKDIVSKSKDAISPAIIVVGEVVNLREELRWFD